MLCFKVGYLRFSFFIAEKDKSLKKILLIAVVVAAAAVILRI
jgi:hypothetical protein